jgi:hypothetical protein
VGYSPHNRRTAVSEKSFATDLVFLESHTRDVDKWGQQMKPKPIRMAGTATFNAFSYLLNGSFSLLETAKEHSPGSNYCRVSAVLFAAFAVEAHLEAIPELDLRCSRLMS